MVRTPTQLVSLSVLLTESSRQLWMEDMVSTIVGTAHSPFQIQPPGGLAPSQPPGPYTAPKLIALYNPQTQCPMQRTAPKLSALYSPQTQCPIQRPNSVPYTIDG